MDGCGCIQADSAAGHARHCHWIVSYDALGDARPPGARADRLRLRRYPLGTPRDVTTTGSRPERRAADAEPLGTRVRLRVRPIASGSSPIIRRMSPHRPLPTPMLLGSV